MTIDLKTVDVIAPNFKRRLSGVTSTIVRLVPLQARDIGIVATGAGLPDTVPQVSMWRVIAMRRKGPSGCRVWHARRNVEMLAGLALRHLLRKRLRLVFTSASQRHHTWLTRALIRRMDHVIATSRKTASYLEREATVVLHGIDAETFRPPESRQAIRAKLGLPVEGRLVGCFGRIRAQKGTDAFVDAMLEVLKDRPDVHAVVMGRAVGKDQPFEADLKERVRAAGMADRILFPPEVPVWAMPDWYQALDLYVAPQRWEGFGLTPLEAMACAVPVVATRVGAFDELVADQETGILVEPGDAHAIAAATSELLDDAAKLTGFGLAARTRIEERFRIEGEAATLVGIYRQLLQGG